MGYKIFEWEKDIQMKHLKNENLTYLSEIKLLKLEFNTDETTTLLEIERHGKAYKIFSWKLLHKGIAKFFFGEEIQTGF